MCLHTHARKDPTRTVTLRRRFESEITARFRRLKKLIRMAIIDERGFGDPRRPITNLAQFDFPRSEQKITEFMDWLRQQERRGDVAILPVMRRTGLSADAWPNTYIDSAYQAGIRRARVELRNQGVDVPSDDAVNGVAMGFNHPFHVDRVGLIYTRVLSELEGITEEMDKQISRVLAQGMIEGRNPLDIARLMEDRVDKIGISRARLLARTEVIRAHHLANIQEYKNAGIENVQVVAEFASADDGRVCPECKSLDGKLYTVKAIESIIPVHPNCRCVAIPRLREDIKGQKVRGRA